MSNFLSKDEINDLRSKINRQTPTEWIAYTPTVNWTSLDVSAFYRVVGDSMDIRLSGSFTGAPTGDNGCPMSLPSGYTINSSKVPSIITQMVFYRGGVFEVMRHSSVGTGSSFTAVTPSSPFTLNGSDSVWLMYDYPVTEWV